MRSIRLLCLVLVLACHEGVTDPPTPVSFTNIYQSNQSKFTAPTLRVIRTEADWRAVWPEIYSSSPTPEPPQVDFTQNDVIVASKGSEPDSCWTTHVVQVSKTGTVATINVEHRRPQQSCSCPPVVAHPVHAVSVPRLPANAHFVVSTKITNQGC